MHSPPPFARLFAALLIAAPVAPFAQVLDAPPGLAGDAVPGVEDFALDQGDPPARVGRIARLTGPGAELRLPGEESFRPGRVNEPLVGGQAVGTPPGGRAELDFGGTRLFLDGDSALELADVPEAGLRAVLGRGAVLVRLAGSADTGESAEIVVPDATVTLPRDGRVLIEAGGPGRPSRIAVFEGEAEVATPGERFRLTRGEAVLLAEGEPPRRERAGAGNALVAWAVGAAPRRAPPVAARGMTGADDLGVYGGWQTDANYGDVWYPRNVGESWVPFSDGNWEWRDPWGWTWIDAAPWGFATAHYGRWVRVGPRWGWAPAPIRGGYGFGGPRFRPIYAPAVVAFFGGVRMGFGGGRPVGWVPLGPREAYYPWYRASPGYVQRANLRTVVNVREVRNVWVDRGRDGGVDRRPGGLNNFANRRGATVVPEDALLRSRPVGAVGRRPGQDQAGRAETLVGLPVRPTTETRGVTPRVVERLGLREGGGEAARDGDRRRDAGRDAGAGEARRDDSPREAGRDDAPREAGRDGTPRNPRPAADRREGDGLPRGGDRPPSAGDTRQRPAIADAERDAAERQRQRAAQAASERVRDTERQRGAAAQRDAAEGQQRAAAQREAAERQRGAEAQRDAAERQRGAEAQRQRAAQQEGERQRAAQQQQRAAQQQQLQQQRAAQQDGERRRAEDAQRQRAEGDRQRAAQAQREQAASQRAAEAGRQRAMERQRQEANQQLRQERNPGAQREERAAQRQQERGERQR